MEQTLTEAEIWQILNDVKDPEIPVVSLVEMGIVRAVELTGRQVTVTITPTFSGCPALPVMKQDIKERLKALGFDSVEVKETLNPPWSSDWITHEARQKLKACGLAPPPRHGGNVEILLLERATCPYCNSENTTLKNSFGPTLCRAIYT
ncbi:MAG: 1,2-phenylacetyl-CoA epoxidase subunit PaaD, partial [Chloroflexota bacterium]